MKLQIWDTAGQERFHYITRCTCQWEPEGDGQRRVQSLVRKVFYKCLCVCLQRTIEALWPSYLYLMYLIGTVSLVSRSDTIEPSSTRVCVFMSDINKWLEQIDVHGGGCCCWRSYCICDGAAEQHVTKLIVGNKKDMPETRVS